MWELIQKLPIYCFILQTLVFNINFLTYSIKGQLMVISILLNNHLIYYIYNFILLMKRLEVIRKYMNKDKLILI